MAFKVKLNEQLRERLDSLAERQGLSRMAFVHQAIENEILRGETEHAREEIALLELEKNFAREGESLTVPIEGYSDFPASAGDHCDLCAAEMTPLPASVDGPHFCDECLALAKGGDFSRLEPGP